jgi:hypothetical protein
MIVTEYEVGPGAYGVALGADGAAWIALETGTLIHLTESE